MMIQNKRKIAFILFVLISVVCLAQDPPIPPYGEEPLLPIDSCILIGAFVALFYGVKKLLKNN